MKKLFVLLSVILIGHVSMAQSSHAIRDENGRHVIGRGFVIVTNNSYFDAGDYVRMVRLGANFQVIRLELGRLSSFPGAKLEPDYLLKLDTLVGLGKEAGIKTIFKMTMYGVRSFSWEKFWLNDNKAQQTYLSAWRVVWDRYKDEDWVAGYDLVNEPRKLTMDISYDDLTTKYLIPYYQNLIDASQKINPAKYCLIQSIFMNKGEAINGNQYAEIPVPVNRDKILFAPHIYQENRDLVKPTLLRFRKESDMLEAPVFIGEWGFPTYATTDSTLVGVHGQLNYMDFYIRTAELFDSLGYNTIKAWFSGNPMMQNFLPGGRSTWAIFNDKRPVGTVERKYITDIIARPYPQAVAGNLKSFKYNFATRSLDVFIETDNGKGSSQLFIGANRHYPDGFTVVLNDRKVLGYNPLKNVGLEVYKSEKGIEPSHFIWDTHKQQLHILKWPVDNSELHLRIIPGFYN